MAGHFDPSAAALLYCMLVLCNSSIGRQRIRGGAELAHGVEGALSKHDRCFSGMRARTSLQILLLHRAECCFTTIRQLMPRYFPVRFSPIAALLLVIGCSHANVQLSDPHLLLENRAKNQTRSAVFADVSPPGARNRVSMLHSEDAVRAKEGVHEGPGDADGYFVGIALSGGGVALLGELRRCVPFPTATASGSCAMSITSRRSAADR